jgi:hypothetical protein
MGLLDKANNAIGAVNQSIGRARSIFDSRGNPNDQSISLTFPLDLRDNLGKYPILRFLALDETKNEKEILLPMPQGGISFNDGGQYGQIDLGLIAGSIAETANSSDGNLRAGAEEFWSKAVNSYKQGQTAAILANIVTDNQTVKFATGLGATLLPPNTNTTFTNNNLRQFSFQFKLTASSSNGSKVIRDIVSTFRRLTYASNGTDEETLILNYPPVWNISFLELSDGGLSENKYIPRIGESYLTNITTTYNSSSNLLHTDGAPTEVDINVNFQETRVHTRRDIDDLEARDK